SAFGKSKDIHFRRAGRRLAPAGDLKDFPIRRDRRGTPLPGIERTTRQNCCYRLSRRVRHIQSPALLKTSISIVTGGNRGLGRNTAISVDRHGSEVILTYRDGAQGAQAVVAEIEALGRGCALSCAACSITS